MCDDAVRIGEVTIIGGEMGQVATRYARGGGTGGGEWGARRRMAPTTHDGGRPNKYQRSPVVAVR